MSRQSNAERGRTVRARLLTAARELIGELGWNAVSTRTLAERAGVRSGLVHYHFESLQALLRQATLEEMRRMIDGIAEVLAATADPAAGIDAVLAELDQYTGTDPASLLCIEGYLAATRDPQLREQMGALMIDFRSAFAASLGRSGHPAPEAAATLVMAALDGFLLHKGLDPELSAAGIAPLLRQLTDTESKGELE